jgi:hypothetical protein
MSSYSRRGFQCKFTALTQSPEGRGEHRRSGGHAETYQDVLAALLVETLSEQLLEAFTLQKVRRRQVWLIGGMHEPRPVRYRRLEPPLS